MKTTRTIVTILSLLVSTVLLLPSAAFAQSVDSDATVAGRGRLAARGTGTVDVEMTGKASMRLTGTITIVDNAGDLRLVTRTGGKDTREITHLEGSTITLEDFEGRVKLRGSDFSFAIDGSIRRFRAKGQGTAVLEGDGVYRTRGQRWTAWDGAVEIAPPKVEAAP